MTQEEIDRCEFWVTANGLVRQSNDHNCKKLKIQVNNKWELDKMEKMLQGYKDIKVVDFLRYGWPLNNEDTVIDMVVPRN